MPFCQLCCESEAILSKTFCPGNRDGVFTWTKIQPGCRDLGNRAIPPFHLNFPKFLQMILWCTEISETRPARSIGIILRGPKPPPYSCSRLCSRLCSRVLARTLARPSKAPLTGVLRARQNIGGKVVCHGRGRPWRVWYMV